MTSMRLRRCWFVKYDIESFSGYMPFIRLAADSAGRSSVFEGEQIGEKYGETK